MATIVEAWTQLGQARDGLAGTLGHLREIMDAAGDDQQELKELCSEVRQDLKSNVRAKIAAAAGILGQIENDQIVEEYRRAAAELKSFVAAAVTVTKADLDQADAQVAGALESFERHLSELDVTPVDKEQLNGMIDSLKAEVARQQEWGERIGRVASTLVGLGKTAVKLLA
jgi:hypothetical protein